MTPFSAVDHDMLRQIQTFADSKTFATVFGGAQPRLLKSGMFLIAPLIITTAICSQPSRYAVARTNSSTLALNGRTAPCNTAWARSGLRLLGNNVGKIAFNAVPMVCGCPSHVSSIVRDTTQLDSLEERFGVTSLCTTLKLPGAVSSCTPSEGACGRYSLTGRFRRLTPCGFNSFWLIGLYSAKSWFLTPSQSCLLSSLLRNMTVFPVPVRK
jgi:hypothetical protein